MKLLDLIKIKEKKLNFLLIVETRHLPNIYKVLSSWMSYHLSFISNKQKIICNSGYGKYLSSKLSRH